MPRLVKDDAKPRHTARREALVLTQKVVGPSSCFAAIRSSSDSVVGSDGKLSHEGH